MDPTNKPLSVKLMGIVLRVLGLVAPRYVAGIYANLIQTPTRGSLRPQDAALLDASTPLPTDTAITAWAFNAIEPSTDSNAPAADHNRPTALLVHGWSFRGVHMSGFLQPLLTAGYRVVIVDLPAHGASTGKRTSPLKTTAQLAEFVAELGEVDTVIAHSFGALCSMRLAAAGTLALKNAVTLACPKVYIFEEAADYVGARGRARQYLLENLADFDDGQPADTANLYHASTGCRWLQIHSQDDPVVEYEKHGKYLHDTHGTSLHTVNGLGHTKILWADETIAATMDFLQHR